MSKMRKLSWFPIIVLLFSTFTSQVLGASNFIRVPLGKGASIEVPGMGQACIVALLIPASESAF